MLASPSGFKTGLCLLHDVGKSEGLAMGYVAYTFQTKVNKTQRNLDALSRLPNRFPVDFPANGDYNSFRSFSVNVS